MRGLLVGLVLVLGLILAIYLVRHQGKSQLEQDLAAQQRAMIELTKANLSSLEKIILAFLSQQGRLPKDFEELRQSRLLVGPAIDAWGRELRLETIGEEGFRLLSAGADGQFGTEDDIALTR